MPEHVGGPLTELRELLQRATPGPWQVDGPYWWHAGDLKPVITVGEDRDAVAIMPPDGTGTTVDRHHADAGLIVALRNRGEALLEIAEAATRYLTDLDGPEGAAEDADLRAALASLAGVPSAKEPTDA